MKLSKPKMARKACKKPPRRPSTLVLSDINMPIMTGIEMLRSLRKLAQYKFTPIVLVTTESQPEKKQEGKAAGATGWIVKPFEPQQLLDVVTKVLRC